MKNHFTYILFILLLIVQSTFSQEEVEKHPLLTDRFVFLGGVFFPNKAISFGVDGELIDREIDVGESFDVYKYQSTMDIGFQWRFLKKWKLVADYYNVSNVSEASLDEPIIWGDYEFDGRVKFGANIGVMRTLIGRTFSQGLKHEFGAGLGFHAMLISLSLDGDASLTGEDGIIETDFQALSTDATAPLPDIGLWYYWTPNRRWALTANVDWLYIAIGDYKGGLWDITGGVQYQVVKFFGVGVNYKYFAVDLEVDQGGDIGDWRGSINVTYNGPMVLVNFNF